MHYRRGAVLAAVVLISMAIPVWAQEHGESRTVGAKHDLGGMTNVDWSAAPRAVPEANRAPSFRLVPDTIVPNNATVYMSGSTSYQYAGNQAKLMVDQVSNVGSVTTGTLRLTLWFSAAPFPAAGYETSDYSLGALAGHTNFTSINSGFIPWTVPPTGCYYVALILEELVSSTWTYDDYVNYSNKQSINGGCNPPPTVDSFTASPSTIPSGGLSALTWTTSNATTVTIDNGIGSRAVNASTNVAPSVTTTYTLTASNGSQQATRTATVTVTAAAVTINSFSAAPATITAGQSSTLTWTTANATTVNIDNGVGSQVVNGSASVSPASTTTYTLTASNGAQQVTRTATITVNPAPPTTRIVSVAGSTAGSFGSFFRTSMQLHNNNTGPVTGVLTFHPSGSAASSGDPSLPFSLSPGQTQAIDDLVAALNTSGVGSLDITSSNIDSLLLNSRIYNDAGAAGTTGMGIDPVSPNDALQQGDSGIILAPASPDAFRFNIGVRTLGSGATLQIVLLDANGVQRQSTSRTYGANTFQQTSASDFAGAAPAANETVVVTVTAGSVIVYGSITDNKTQDPTYQAARSVAALHNRGQVAKLVIPVVGSAAGSFGSFFRTSVQLHNAGSSTINGTFVFHPEGVAASVNDPTSSYTLTAGQTKSMSDIVASMNTSGIGSLDITSSDFTSLLLLARIYNDAGANGTTGMGLDPMSPSDALQPGDTGVLIAPAHTDVFRYNIGVRTLDGGASLLFTVIDSNGNTRHSVSRDVSANFFQQYGSSDLLGITIGNNDAVLITVNSGSAIIYGSITDNRTQDPTYATARKR